MLRWFWAFYADDGKRQSFFCTIRNTLGREAPKEVGSQVIMPRFHLNCLKIKEEKGQ